MDLRAMGMKHAEIARLTGYTRTRVTELLNCPAGKQYLGEIRQNVGEIADKWPHFSSRAREKRQL
jgi:hypothetical protein